MILPLAQFVGLVILLKLKVNKVWDEDGVGVTVGVLVGVFVGVVVGSGVCVLVGVGDGLGKQLLQSPKCSDIKNTFGVNATIPPISKQIWLDGEPVYPIILELSEIVFGKYIE